MTEEEYFRKNYPDSCYGDKPLSPHWDFFQDGVEFGERQSEKKIEELERALSAMEKGTCDICKVKDAEFYEKRIAELEAQNEKLQNCWNCKKSFNKSCSFGKKCEADKKKCNELEIKEK